MRREVEHHPRQAESQSGTPARHASTLSRGDGAVLIDPNRNDAYHTVHRSILLAYYA